MNIVITMAGEGKRFKDVGYNIPKFKIEIAGNTMFHWSMLSLEDFYNLKDTKFIFITRKIDDAKSLIYNEMFSKNVKKEQIFIIELDEVTDGQATSALKAKKFWNENEELIIYNIDTYVEANNIKYNDFKGDGFIPCFNALGDHWSFVKLDKDGNAIEVKEKERISNNCTIGLYYFKSCKLYERIYCDYYNNDNNKINNEKYIAPMYNYMINSGMKVKICEIDKEKVHVLGTPTELELFINNFEKNKA